MPTENWKKLANEHWKQFLPNRYKELQQSEKLDQALEDAVEHTRREINQLEGQGFHLYEAWEMVRTKYLFLPKELADDTKKSSSGFQINKDLKNVQVINFEKDNILISPVIDTKEHKPDSHSKKHKTYYEAVHSIYLAVEKSRMSHERKNKYIRISIYTLTIFLVIALAILSYRQVNLNPKEKIARQLSSCLSVAEDMITDDFFKNYSYFAGDRAYIYLFDEFTEICMWNRWRLREVNGQWKRDNDNNNGN